MTNKSTVTRVNRDLFIEKFGIESLRNLAAIRKNEAGLNVNVPVSKTSVRTIKGNLNRGLYRPFVGPNFSRDKMNLIDCDR